MMRKTTILLILSIALLTISCGGNTQEPPMPNADPSSESLVPTPTTGDKNERDKGNAVKITLKPASIARYRITEQLARRNLPNDAVGETKDIIGDIYLKPDGSVDSKPSLITIGLASLKSDEGRRDRYVRNNTLETESYSTATVIPKEFIDLPWPLPNNQEFLFSMLTDTTIHGVTSNLLWKVTATSEGGQLSGSAKTNFTFDTFKLTQPKLAFILSIKDNIRLELDFLAEVRDRP
ncbi:MAG: YceI-like domain-containing protein [Chloroflexi bacterium]|jgi:polyisoprenoid-binding protein YceI|nr:MAG: YceI-like domain-containing protein [Chloroflexota bacterium]